MWSYFDFDFSAQSLRHGKYDIMRKNFSNLTYIWTKMSSVIGCLTSEKSINLSEPQFLQVQISRY